MVEVSLSGMILETGKACDEAMTTKCETDSAEARELPSAPETEPRPWDRLSSGDRPAAWIAAGTAILLAVIALISLVQGEDSPAARPVLSDLAGKSPPPAEPLVFAPIAASAAKDINDAVPFAADRGPTARSFIFGGAADSRERAVDCLASAMWYEAGGNARGQHAVAQVVLNRVRHPAYPATVCGVVFQGSERRTGCQFTFTCDGAMRRTPPPSSFALVRDRARAMLEGRVHAEVGLATHYHTDWVHPIWSAKLEKIAQVDTHLFFRWSGVWGSPAAQRKPYRGGEPVVGALAFLSPFHRTAVPVDPAAAASGTPLPPGTPPPLPKPQDLGGGRFRIFMSPARSGNVQALLAFEHCGTREYCKLTGVLGEPGLTPARPTVVFVYLRDRAAGIERAMWDCDVFKRPTKAQCFGARRDIPGDSPRRQHPAPMPTAAESASAGAPSG